MFKDEELFVSVMTAKEKIEDIEHKFNNDLEKQEEEYQDIVVGMINLINLMKSSHASSKPLFVNYGSGDYNYFEIGKKTSFVTNGIELYVGDEILLPNDKLGVVEGESDGVLNIVTNKERYSIVSQFHKHKHEIMMVRNSISSNDITVNKHFNTLKVGDEISIGRKTGKGFLITDKKKKKEV